IATILANGDQAGLGGQIIIPDIVVHDLKLPHQLATRSAKRNDRVSIGIAAQPLAAVVVRAGAASGYEHAVPSDIDRELSPDVGRAGASGAVFGPGLEGRVGLVTRDGVPQPAQRSRAGIEGTDKAALQRRGPIIADGRADDDEVANYNRW